MEKITRIKGISDLFPPVSQCHIFLEQTARDIFGRYGFSEIRTPILEKTELFARSIGDETDIVQKEMYTFADRKGRLLTLRPEATAGVVRAYIENGLQAKAEISRLFTFGPMFRYERPQKGRQRQFHQLNVEVFGSPAPELDAEMMLMLNHYLLSIGIDDFSFEVNSLGCPDCRPKYQDALNNYFKGMHKEHLCDDCLRRKLTNPLRVLDCKVPGCREITLDAPVITDFLCPDCLTHQDKVLQIASECGLPFKINPRLVRGLDYYVRTTFEVVSGGIGAQSSIAGGGRYDGLVKSLGGPDVPGIGFALGMERLTLLLEPRSSLPPDFFLACLDAAGLAASIPLAQKLRLAGLRGETALTVKSLKSQMRQADKSGALFCLFLGERELSGGQIGIRYMSDSTQSDVSLENIAQFILEKRNV